MVITGTTGPDNLIGTSADDQISGGNGDDTINGAGGNDTLDGGDGNNTYLFGKGDGADLLKERLDATDYTGNALGKLNTLQFKAGVSPAEVTAARVGSDLVFKILGADSFLVQSYFRNSDPYNDNNVVQQVKFADGTTLDLVAINSLAFTGSAGADTIVGTTRDDTINGAAGNDILDGGDGNNTYLFGKGDGADLLKERLDATDYTGNALGKLNTLQFKAGVSPAEVTAARVGSDLVFKILGADSFLVQSYFRNSDPYNDNNVVQQVKFADGTTLDLVAINSLAFTGSAGADTIVGTTRDDTINGAAGNDILDGGDGNNTYLFGKGDGADLLKERLDATDYTGNALGKLNTLQFKAGVSPGDLFATKSGSNLSLNVLGNDSVIVEGFLRNNSGSSDFNPLQQLVFADGTVWDLAMIVGKIAIVRNGSSAADAIVGTAGSDQIFGLDGRDTISGGAGNDVIDGGAGVDTAALAGPRGSFVVQKAAAGFVVTSVNSNTGEGADLLIDVERLSFNDAKLALDLDGLSGTVAKTLGAVFGRESVGVREYVGIGLSFLDAGMSYEGLMQLALDARLGPGASHGAVVDLLFSNVVGVAPPVAERAYFTNLLDVGVYTPASLGVLAADTSINVVNIDLVGLTETGLPYVGG